MQIASTRSQATPVFPEQTITAVYRHSRGFPRLINTICENALVAAYARQIQSVTPDIIDDVATDFRLDVVHLPQPKTAGGHNGMDVQRTTNVVLPDLYSPLQEPVASEVDLGVSWPFK